MEPETYIETLPLFEADDNEPDPDLVGVCDGCGAILDDPFDNLCELCWVAGQ